MPLPLVLCWVSGGVVWWFCRMVFFHFLYLKQQPPSLPNTNESRSRKRLKVDNNNIIQRAAKKVVPNEPNPLV